MKAIKGRDIIDVTASKTLKAGSVAEMEVITAHGHMELLELHARAIACHCECLGMNAENCQRASLGQSMAYSDDSYLTCMNKWGLMNEKGEPTI